MDTLPASLLYLEAMETAPAQAAGLPSVRRGSGLGQAVCLLPKGRMGHRLQSDHGHDGNGSTAPAEGVYPVSGILPRCQVRRPNQAQTKVESEVRSMNRRIRGPYVRWCERAEVADPYYFWSPFPTRLGAFILSHLFLFLSKPHSVSRVRLLNLLSSAD